MVLMQSNKDALKLGEKAPNFSLKNASTGDIISRENLKGKPLVVIFICNHCPFVVPKFEEIKQLQDEFLNVSIVCINPNNNPAFEQDDWPHTQELAKKQGYKYYLFDGTQETAKSYGAVCTPDAFIFNKFHRLIYHGRINDDTGMSNNPKKHDIKEILLDLQKEKLPKDWFRPSQGCSIKWNN